MQQRRSDQGLHWLLVHCQCCTFEKLGVLSVLVSYALAVQAVDMIQTVTSLANCSMNLSKVVRV